MRTRWDLVGGAVALVTSAVDLWMFGEWGLDVPGLTAHAVGWLVLGSFVMGYGFLGWALGRLWMARARAIADGAQIQRQLEALEESRAQLVQSEKLAALGRLAASIAHEVRNPLGVIRASASMVQEGFEEGTEDHRACELITDEIDRLDGLIGALLAFAKPARMSLSQTELAPVIERAVKLVTESRPLAVEPRIDGPAELRADPDLLTQLLLGLFVNASEAGAGRVRVRAHAEGDRVAIEIADDGPGVPEGQRETVFEPFFTTKASGTGLGLPMAARIVEAHGGRIELGDDPALGGARFTVRLPLGGPAALVEAA